jgi:hypothetical protein
MLCQGIHQIPFLCIQEELQTQKDAVVLKTGEHAMGQMDAKR